MRLDEVGEQPGRSGRQRDVQRIAEGAPSSGLEGLPQRAGHRVERHPLPPLRSGATPLVPQPAGSRVEEEIPLSEPTTHDTAVQRRSHAGEGQRLGLDPRDERSDEDFYELIGDDTGVFGCMSLLGCHDVCPKGLPLQTQIAFLRRKMAVVGLK